MVAPPAVTPPGLLPPDPSIALQSMDDTSRPSFASMVGSKTPARPRLQPVPLASRPTAFIGKSPAVLFSPVEVEQLNRQVDNTLIMKFSGGRPSLQEIRAHILSEWKLDNEPAVGLLDPRHITIHMGSISDAKRALARHSKMIKNCMFRLFRWTPDFQLGKDSCLAPVWVRFPKLPLQYFNITALERIGACLGTVLSADDRTLSFTHGMYARVCIEIDVSQPFPSEIWIGISKEQGWWQKVEYEGNIAYCTHCGLLGHIAGCCRKKVANRNAHVVEKTKKRMEYVPKVATEVIKPTDKNVEGTSAQNEGQKMGSQPQSPKILKRSDFEDKNSSEVREILKDTGLISEEEVVVSSPLNGNRFAALQVENESLSDSDQELQQNVVKTTVHSVETVVDRVDGTNVSTDVAQNLEKDEVNKQAIVNVEEKRKPGRPRKVQEPETSSEVS